MECLRISINSGRYYPWHPWFSFLKDNTGNHGFHEYHGSGLHPHNAPHFYTADPCEKPGSAHAGHFIRGHPWHPWFSFLKDNTGNHGFHEYHGSGLHPDNAPHFYTADPCGSRGSAHAGHFIRGHPWHPWFSFLKDNTGNHGFHEYHGSGLHPDNAPHFYTADPCGSEAAPMQVILSVAIRGIRPGYISLGP